MAAIDKIYLEKKDVPEFYKYLNKIDSDFKKYFINAGSILNYTYQGSADNLDDWNGDIIPVSNFPTMVDRWLAHREDLPDFIKDRLIEQYSGYYHKGYTNDIFNEPVYNESDKEISHKFKIRKWTKCKGKKWKHAITFWSVEPHTDEIYNYVWIEEINKFVDYSYLKPEHIGYDLSFGLSSKDFKSIKAMFRFLRKHGFPKGTKVSITDWRYLISKIEIEFV